MEGPVTDMGEWPCLRVLFETVNVKLQNDSFYMSDMMRLHMTSFLVAVTPGTHYSPCSDFCP